MGLFSKKRAPVDETVDVTTPFVFRVGDVFTITGRGRMFTGTVESGAVAVNAPATLLVGDCALPAQVKRLESRKRRNPVVLIAGDVGAIELAGVDTNDLPLRVYGGQMVVDDRALRGAVIRSR
ncbi:elongation factor Tu [Corynebacterium sp.]|uniref:elongation factor Tu n=1 Tax=Corynebacterium sp. TaxID=1720 RepID=UPI0037C08875